MRHKMGYKKLNRTSEHRKALIKNMLNSLIKYEQITTTLPKAKVLKPQADKIITLGKKDTLSNTKSLNEIKEVLTGMSLYLGMEIPNWPPDNIAELSKKLEEAI